VGAGKPLLRGAVVSEPVLLVPPGAPGHHGHLGADRGGAAGAVDGGDDDETRVPERDTVGVQAEPRAVQREGARSDNYICELRRRQRVRHSRSYGCQNLLPSTHLLFCFSACSDHHTGSLNN